MKLEIVTEFDDASGDWTASVADGKTGGDFIVAFSFPSQKEAYECILRLLRARLPKKSFIFGKPKWSGDWRTDTSVKEKKS